MKVLIIFALNCFMLSYSWPHNKVENKMKMSIYYETMCGDSKRFITNQLYPAYNTIKNYLRIEFIPYGKATSNQIKDSWIFKCQHGSLECWGNKVQACVLSQNVEQDKQMEFINCFMSTETRVSSSLVETCSAKAGLSTSKIWQCVESGLGDKLHAMYGTMTNKAVPSLTFVPTIIFNDKYDDEVNEKSAENLLRTVSRVLDTKENVIQERMFSKSKDEKETHKHNFEIPGRTYPNKISVQLQS